jgi:hypothetical protein
MFYKKAIELGFQREDLRDNVWEDIHGFGYFVMTKKLIKSLYLDWDVLSHQITLIKGGKEGKIISTMKIKDDLAIKLIEFFKK